MAEDKTHKQKSGNAGFAEEPKRPPVLDAPSRSVLESFAEFEHSHLLHYVYLGDIRGVAIFTVLGGGLAFYFTRPTVTASTETVLFDVLSLAWLALAAAGFTLAGIAVCPIPFRKFLPKGRAAGDPRRKQPEDRDPGVNHTSVTHYLDIAQCANSDEYIAQVTRIHGCQISPKDGLLCEKLRECYELAVILRGKMACLFYAFSLSGFAMLVLVFALGVVGVGKAPSITHMISRITHVSVPNR